MRNVAEKPLLELPAPKTTKVPDLPATTEVASVEGASTPPAPSTFKPVGYVEKAGGQAEAIILQDDQVYVVHVGERFADKYRVLKVSPDAVEAMEDMPPPAAPQNIKSGDSKVLSANLTTSTPDQPTAQKPLASSTAPSGLGHGATMPTKLVGSALPPRQEEEKAATHPSTLATAQPVGYVERANGRVEAIVPDGDSVQLVAQAREMVTDHIASPSIFPSGSSVENPGAGNAQVLTPPVAEVEDATVSPGEAPAEISAVPDHPVENPSLPSVSGFGVGALLDPAEQVLAAPSAGMSLSEVHPPGNPSPISEGAPTETANSSTFPPNNTVNPLGFIEKCDGELDAIVSEDDEVFVVRQGETFGGRFRAVRVSRDAVEVAEVSPQLKPDRSPPQLLGMPDLLSFDFRAGPALPNWGDPGFEFQGENAGAAQVPVEQLASSGKNRLSRRERGVAASHAQVKSAAAAMPSPGTGIVIFQTLGSVETANGEDEAIVAKGSQVYLVKQGERFADQYWAVSVGPSLVLASRAAPGSEDFLYSQTDSSKKPASKIKREFLQQSGAANPQVLQGMDAPGGSGLAELGVTLFDTSGFTGYDLQLHMAMADSPND
jgi:Tfp pilus assembly protein PilP